MEYHRNTQRIWVLHGVRQNGSEFGHCLTGRLFAIRSRRAVRKCRPVRIDNGGRPWQKSPERVHLKMASLQVRRLRNHRIITFDRTFPIDEREVMTEQGLCYSVNGPITALLQSKYFNESIFFSRTGKRNEVTLQFLFPSKIIPTKLILNIIPQCKECKEIWEASDM